MADDQSFSDDFNRSSNPLNPNWTQAPPNGSTDWIRMPPQTGDAIITRIMTYPDLDPLIAAATKLGAKAGDRVTGTYRRVNGQAELDLESVKIEGVQHDFYMTDRRRGFGMRVDAASIPPTEIEAWAVSDDPDSVTP